MPVTFVDLLQQLTPDVQYSMTKLHKEVFVIVQKRVILDEEGKKALETKF